MVVAGVESVSGFHIKWDILYKKSSLYFQAQLVFVLCLQVLHF